MKYTLLLPLLLLAQIVQAEAQTAVYVWDFSTRDGEQTSTTSSLTREFEEALSGNPEYRVVEGREPNRLLAQRHNVAALQDLTGASQGLIQDLKSYQVDQVVFGEFFDDIDSGQVVVTVTFQKLDGTKALIKSTSVSRGMINDRQTRVDALQQLVSNITERTRKIDRFSIAGFMFNLEKCTMSNRTVRCSLNVVNNQDDRELRISRLDYGNSTPSRIYDNSGRETLVTSVRLANQVDNDYRFTHTLLVGSLSTELVASFEGVSSSATSITRLELNCWEGESQQYFQVIFRNIPIEKS